MLFMRYNRAALNLGRNWNFTLREMESAVLARGENDLLNIIFTCLFANDSEAAKIKSASELHAEQIFKPGEWNRRLRDDVGRWFTNIREIDQVHLSLHSTH